MADDRWRAWLALLRAGDVLVREEVVVAYFDYVFRALLTISSNLNSKWYSPLPYPRIVELAEELTGLAFAQAFDRIHLFDENKSALPTWIVMQGRSRMKGTVFKEIREAARESSVGSEEVTDRAFAGVLDDPEVDPSEQVLDRMEAAERARLVQEVLGGMLPDQRRALVLAYVQRPPDHGGVAAVARALGRSPVAADSLLRRAVRDFRRRWAELARREGLES